MGPLSIGPHHDGQDLEVSYQFLPEYWGLGLASESVGAFIVGMRGRLGYDSVTAETQTANPRSTRLLEALGFLRKRTLIRFDAEQVIYRKQLH